MPALTTFNTGDLYITVLAIGIGALALGIVAVVAIVNLRMRRDRRE